MNKTKLNNENYTAPECVVVEMNTEGVLCASGGIEQLSENEELYGW